MSDLLLNSTFQCQICKHDPSTLFYIYIYIYMIQKGKEGKGDVSYYIIVTIVLFESSWFLCFSCCLQVMLTDFAVSN